MYLLSLWVNKIETLSRPTPAYYNLELKCLLQKWRTHQRAIIQTLSLQLKRIFPKNYYYGMIDFWDKESEDNWVADVDERKRFVQ